MIIVFLTCKVVKKKIELILLKCLLFYLRIIVVCREIVMFREVRAIANWRKDGGIHWFPLINRFSSEKQFLAKTFVKLKSSNNIYLRLFCRQNVHDGGVAESAANVRRHTVRRVVAVQRHTGAKGQDRGPFLRPRVRRRGVRAGLSRQRPAGRPIKR